MELTKLTEPFPPEKIKQRKGRGGLLLDYIEAHEVIARLNDAFTGEWSFEILDYKILDFEVVVQGKLTAWEQTKVQFGGSDISRHKETDKPVSISDDLKSAGSDALKKCATLFGVGLHLYEEKGNKKTSRKPEESSAPSGNGRRKSNGKVETKPMSNPAGKADVKPHDTTSDTVPQSAPPPDPGVILEFPKKDGISASQYNEIIRLGTELGSDEDGICDWAENSYGVKMKQMSYAQAGKVIADLHKQINEREA